MQRELTRRWSESIFAPRTRPSYRMPAFPYFLARRLHAELVKVLALFPNNAFHIDSGLLLDEDRALMIRSGKAVRESDDAMFGRPVKIEAKSSLIEMFGDWFTFSVGGARLSTTGPAALDEVFRGVAAEARARRVRLGEVGLITGGGYREASVLLVANDKDVALAPDIVNRYFPNYPFLWTSENGGVTVQRI